MVGINPNRAHLVNVIRSTPVHQQTAPETASTTDTLTTDQILAGILVVDQAASGTSTLTTPTATEIETAMGFDVQVNDAFDFFLINIGGTAGENVVLAMGSDVTLVGNNDIEEEDAVENSSSAHFRFRKTAANTFTCYRLA